jgi:dipeptidyl aminopeptidase/acylaminoacyl peptidase
MKTPVLCVSLLLASAGLLASASIAFGQNAAANAVPAVKSSSTVDPLADVGPGIERFIRIRTPGAPAVAPGNVMYVRDQPDGVFQLYRVEGTSVKHDFKGTKLTTYADGLSGFSMSDDASKILLFHAFGGNENIQVSHLNPSTGAITDLLKNPKVQHAVNRWLPGDTGFIYTANDASANDFYIYKYEFTADGAGKITKLLGKPGSWSASDITDDQSRVIVGEYRSASDSSFYELTLASGELKELTNAPTGSTVAVDPVGYMPGEKALLYTSDTENGMKKLFLRDLASGNISKPISALDAYELDGVSMNRERTLLGVTVNQDGYGVLRVYRLPSFEEVTLPQIEKGVVGLTEMRGDRISWVLSNARTPGLTFTYTVPPPGAVNIQAPTAAQLTFADTQGIDLASFPLPELVKYPASDGLEIPAFLFLPANYTKGTPIPFVVNYHGGPEAQFRPGFDRTVQYLLSEGFGVIQPNVRGSSGYGREFVMMDDYKNRWASVRDGVDAAAWLVKNNYAAPGKISTYGGSYGGFMSVACIVEDQQRVDAGTQKERLFGAGINVVGIVNVKTFLEQTSGYRRKLREVEYGPLSDPEFLKSISSIHKIDKINVPMMIAHGLNDPRVPVGEAMQLSIGLMRRGMTPVQFYAPDEGHGFQKLDNRLLFAKTMSRFLKENIR